MVKNREVGFSKPQVKGSGAFKAPEPKPLTCVSKINSYVGWLESNSPKCGILENWDGNIAIINSGGTIVKVDCTNL